MFSCEFSDVFKNIFLQNISRWLLLQSHLSEFMLFIHLLNYIKMDDHWRGFAILIYSDSYHGI